MIEREYERWLSFINRHQTNTSYLFYSILLYSINLCETIKSNINININKSIKHEALRVGLNDHHLNLTTTTTNNRLKERLHSHRIPSSLCLIHHQLIHQLSQLLVSHSCKI